MTPFTTMGVASDPPPPNRGGAASPFNENVHADFSVATLLALICVSGEYRVLAVSWLYEGQSPGAGFACCGVRTRPRNKPAAQIRPESSLVKVVPIR